MFEGTAGTRIFLVHCQCANCLRPSTKRVPIPMIEGAPASVDEFIEVLEHNPMPFSCRYCESLIGELVGVTMENDHAPA
ncbi:MAG: hypothetical protein ABS76_15650 [Pelagibacterium sp. SCN 64-44]|nr:MAG: hypothetical protein ABS76_15650 [Pelagibacterium sp. SCN 64-44]